MNKAPLEQKKNKGFQDNNKAPQTRQELFL